LRILKNKLFTASSQCNFINLWGSHLIGEIFWSIHNLKFTYH